MEFKAESFQERKYGNYLSRQWREHAAGEIDDDSESSSISTGKHSAIAARNCGRKKAVKLSFSGGGSLSQ